jgi:predicted Ser/Thr protein kinase
MTPVRERIGPYRLLEEIGVGGMGEVHLALDPEGRAVAVKILHPAVARDDTSRRRLEREVTTMRRVRSPYVAEVLDADFAATRPYVVTHYVQGRPLSAIVAEHGVLDRSALARLAVGLARALLAIHTAGIVHRDLKPGNVILVGGEPVVIDFGLAHVLDATRLTRTGTAIGTPGYLAPEILDGERAGAAADVFSWASTVTYAATGSSPFGSGPAQAVFSRVLRGRFDVRRLPEPLRSVVADALDLDPERRPTAAALLAALERAKAPKPPRPQQADQPAAPGHRAETPPSPRPQPPDSPSEPRHPNVAEMSRPLDVARSISRGHPALRTVTMLAAPFLCYATPTLAAAVVLGTCSVIYGRDALVRAQRRMRSLGGGILARTGGLLATVVAVPLQVVIRLSVLTGVAAIGYALLLVITVPLVTGPRGWAMPAGLLAVLAGVARARFGRTSRPLRRLAVPVIMVMILALAVLGVPFPAWWPLPD